MKQFTHKFELIPLSQIATQWRQSLQLVTTPNILSIIAREPVVFSQEQQLDEKGLYYKKTFRAIVGAEDTSVKEFNGQRAVIRMTLSDGSTCLLGEKDNAPIIMLTPYENAYVIDVKYASPDAIPL